MKKLILFLAAASIAAASTVTVTVVSTTPQQAILDIAASDNSACTIQVSESATLSPLAYDVDASRFSGSNSCSRTGSIVRNNTYRMVIGKRATATETAGDIVSRSLQAFSTYYYKVTLASGATASGSFTTSNPGLGNSAPDYIPFNAAGAGNYGWPTQHYENIKQADSSIDPLTGFLTTRITGPGMALRTMATGGASFWWDNSGAGWSSACVNASEFNEINHEPDGTYCTYTGAGGQATSLFIKLDSANNLPSAFNYSSNGADLPSGMTRSMSDIQASFSGHGDPLEACLSVDSINCIGNTVEWDINSTPNTPVTLPGSGFPTFNWALFGLDKIDPAWTTGFSGNASVTGQVVTITGNSGAGVAAPLPGFAKAGMHVYMLPNYDPYTIASITDARHFTLSQTVPGGKSYTSYILMNWGMLVWKQAGGTGTTSLGSFAEKTPQDQMYTNGFNGNAGGTCNGTTTMTTDRSGNTVAPFTAKLCHENTQDGGNNMDFVWVPSTGEEWVYNQSTHESGWNYNFSTGKIQECSYTGKYADQAAGPFEVTNSDFVCSIPNTTYTVLDEIKLAHPEIDMNYWAIRTADLGCGYDTTCPGMTQDRDGHTYAVFRAKRNDLADVSYWEFVLDLSAAPGAGQVVEAHNSWSEYPTRWGLSHDQHGPGADSVGNGTSHVDVFKGLGQDTDVPQNNPISGEYVMHPTTVYSNTGSGTSLTNSFFQSCAALGVTDARWIAEEDPARGDNTCIKVNVPNEPVNLFPPSSSDAYDPTDYPKGALTPLADPRYIGSRQSPWAHNASSCGGDNTTANCYGYLQDVIEGDWLQLGNLDSSYPGDSALVYISNSGEKDIVGKKTVLGNGTIDLVLIRGIKDVFGNVGGSPTAQSDGFYIQPMPAQSGLSNVSGEFFFPLNEPFTADNVGIQNPIVDGSHQNSWSLPDGSQIYQEAAVTFNDFGFPQMREMNENNSAHGIRQGVFPQTMKDPFQFAQPGQYPFAAVFQSGKSENSSDPMFGNEQIPMSYIQQHPGAGGSWNTANTSFTGIDFAPMGGGGGGQVPLWLQTSTAVSGQAITYLVQNPQLNNPGACNGSNDLCGFDSSGAVFMTRPDPKRRQIEYWAGPYLLQNISGPGSIINDSKPYTACYALNAGECVSGSTAGQTFEVVPNAELSGTCLIDASQTSPCWATTGPNQTWGYQYDVRAADPWGKRWRRVTMGYNGPGREENYDNLHGDGDGSYLYASCYYCDGYRNDILAVQVPPMPGDDGEARNTFIPFKVQLSGVAGTFVRVRFGYAEYARGGTDNLFCSAERGEECATNVPAGDPDPYTWVGETGATSGWAACDSGCTVNVPAIAGRVLHYVIDRNTGGGTVTSTAEQVVAIN